MVVSALDFGERVEAVAVWSHRRTEAAEAGLTPREALERWRSEPDHPNAGGVPEQARIEELAGLEVLRETADPGYEKPPLPAELSGGPIDFASQAMKDWEWQRWDDFAPVTIGKTYPPRTDQPVRYLPVRLGEELVGYLWAAVTDDAAGFRFLLPADAVGHAADRWWTYELMRLQESGVPPLQALRSRVGAPEDPEGGRIDADAEEHTAPGLDALREIARR